MHEHADETASLEDVSLIGDSPLLRVMSGEHISVEAHDNLVEIARYEERLVQQSA